MASKKFMISGIFLVAAAAMAMASMIWFFYGYSYGLEPLGWLH